MKNVLKDIISEMTPEEIVSSVLDLSKQVVMWQEEYNKASIRIEALTNNKQLKVIVETPENVALSSFGAFKDDNYER